MGHLGFGTADTLASLDVFKGRFESAPDCFQKMDGKYGTGFQFPASITDFSLMFAAAIRRRSMTLMKRKQ